MKIEIRNIGKVEEGTGILAVIPELPKSQYHREDTKEHKRQPRGDSWAEHEAEQKEIKLLHLGEAELTQKENQE